jgi:hypothetical protein
MRSLVNGIKLEPKRKFEYCSGQAFPGQIYQFSRIFAEKHRGMPPLAGYAGGMATIRRRKVTLVITETWTIVWSPADDPLQPTTIMLQDNPKLQEEPDAILSSTLTTTGSDHASADPATTTLHTTAATSDPRSDDTPARPLARRRSQRTRSRLDKAKRSKQ